MEKGDLIFAKQLPLILRHHSTGKSVKTIRDSPSPVPAVFVEEVKDSWNSNPTVWKNLPTNTIAWWRVVIEGSTFIVASTRMTDKIESIDNAY